MPSILTDRQLRAAKPGSEFADSTVGGLRFKVSGTGLKTFFYRYRVPEAPSTLRQLILGHYGTGEGQITLGQARTECLHLREVRKKGVDPQEYRRQLLNEAHAARVADGASAAEAAYTMARLCEDFTRAKDPHWRPKTRKQVTQLINCHITPRWQDRPITELRRGEISDALDSIAATAPTQSNRFLWLVKALFDFALEKERIGANPAAGIKRRVKERPRERALDDTEIKKLLAWLGSDECPLSPDLQDLVRFLLLTGCRLAEACGAHVQEFNLRTTRWALPKERTKSNRDHVVILSRPALELVKRRSNAGRYLWPASRGEGHIRVDSASGAIGKANLDIPHWTAHDIRRTVYTGMGDLGVPSDVADRVLNHRRTGTAARHYDRATRDAQAKQAWQQWADHLDILMGGNVVLMGRKEGA